MLFKLTPKQKRCVLKYYISTLHCYSYDDFVLTVVLTMEAVSTGEWYSALDGTRHVSNAL